MASPDKNPILYLSYDGLTDPLGQSQILPYVIGLSRFGWKFTIISFEKATAYDSGREQIQSICHQYAITWSPLVYHKQPPVLSTLFDLWRLRNTVKKIVSNNHILHCRSYLTALIGFSMKKHCGSKFIFDMRGFWADERVEGGLWNLKNPLFNLIYKFFKRKEKQFLVRADHVISLTRNAKLEIESWQLPAAPITVIPTCVDLDFFSPDKVTELERNQFRMKLGLTGTDFVLLYLGSWGTWYLIDEMLNVFKQLKREKPQAKFLIVTLDEVKLTDYEFKNDVVITKAKRAEVPTLISISSVSVFFIKPSFSKKASSATKLGELLAMRKPVITNHGWGDVDHIQYGKLVQLIHPGKPIDWTWLKTAAADAPALEALSLSNGITAYHQVYLSL